MSGRLVEVTGQRAVAEALDGLGDALDHVLEGPAGALLARTGVRLARGFAPRRTGRLAASITGRARGNRVSITAGNRAVPYASVQEWGWPKRHVPARGFMHRADVRLRQDAVAETARSVDRAITKAGLQ